MKRWHGITYKDYETAKENGISKNTLDTRVYQLGWDIDRAITAPVRGFKNIIAPHLHIAERNGITEGAARARIYRGWSIEDAVSVPLIKGRRKVE